MKYIRPALAALSIVGTFAFTALFLVALLNPIWIEQQARELIRVEVEQRVREKIHGLDEKFLSGRAQKLADAYAKRAQSAKQLLDSGVADNLARVLDEMKNIDCECRKKIVARFKAGLLAEITDAQQMKERLTALIREKYLDTAEKLVRELRIFSGANAIVFAFLGLAVWLKPKANIHLIPAALLLILSAGITGYFYLFGQDWMHTLVFSDYVGLAYFGYLGLAFAFLCDVVFNAARVTLAILDACFSGLSAVGC